jgi:hypothetical protein
MNKEDEILEKLTRIERGIYGDPENKVEGILEKVKQHDDAYRVISFFFKRPKVVVWFGVIFLYVALYLSHKGVDSLFLFLTK